MTYSNNEVEIIRFHQQPEPSFWQLVFARENLKDLAAVAGGIFVLGGFLYTLMLITFVFGV